MSVRYVVNYFILRKEGIVNHLETFNAMILDSEWAPFLCDNCEFKFLTDKM